MKKSSSCAWLLSILGLTAPALAQESSPSKGEREKRVRILVNGAYQPTALGFSDRSTFTSFLEEGSSSRSYQGGKGAVFEGGVIVRIAGPFGVMGSFELYQSDFDGTFQESLPHPLYFDQPRTAAGEIEGLEYRERAVHLDAVFSRSFSAMTLDLFAGPTLFSANTDLLNRVSATSSYPFDEVVVTGTSNLRLDDDPLGFNAGGALTWRLTELFGLAFQARYSRATIAISREGGEPIELDAGGFRVGGGIRLAF